MSAQVGHQARPGLSADRRVKESLARRAALKRRHQRAHAWRPLNSEIAVFEIRGKSGARFGLYIGQGLLGGRVDRFGYPRREKRVLS